MKKTILTAACGLFLAASLSAGAQIIVRVGPPPHRPVERIPPPVHPGWVWHPGYHRWDGAHYVWMPGAYAEPPYRGARWVEGHWSRRGGGYFWVEGHWRH